MVAKSQAKEAVVESYLSFLDSLAPEHQQEGDITLAMAAERWRVSPNTARRRLDRSSELKKIRGILSNGSYGVFYRPPLQP